MQEETKKGPWTEQEDLQLVCFVGLFGDRRWDFIAKVSGLKRTGKSCRLRWVNYLHPGLKHGKMTPHEEKLVLELHSQWGNRWSRIAKKLPGRTDNEIKNYWRTHMRKQSQEKKSSKSPSSNCSSSNCSSNNDTSDYNKVSIETTTQEFSEGQQQVYSMDDIWKDITPSEEAIWEQGSNLYCWPPIASPLWDYCPDTLWKMDDQDSNMFNDPFFPC